MENDNANLPAGYAKAMVEMYVNQPELFTRENIEKWQNTAVPVLEKTNGSCKILKGKEAEDFYRAVADAHKAECVPISDGEAGSGLDQGDPEPDAEGVVVQQCDF